MGWASSRAGRTPGIALPVPLTDASGAATATGMYIFGGRTTGDALSAATYRAAIPIGHTDLASCEELTEIPLPEARAGASAVSGGISIWVVGGQGPAGVTNSIFYLGLDQHGAPAVDPATGRPRGWGVSVDQSASAALPEPRQHATGFGNGGALYVIGGEDANGQKVATNYWTVPNASNGTIASWTSLDATNLPEPRALGAPAISGSAVFMIGGTGANNEDLNSIVRADLAPSPPSSGSGCSV